MAQPLASLLASLLPVRDALGREVLSLAPGQDLAALPDSGPLTVTLAVHAYDEDDMSSMMEQPVELLPAAHREHPSREAFLRASLASVPAILEEEFPDGTAPSDLFFPELLALTASADQATFAAWIADPARREQLRDAREDRERREAYAAAVGPERVEALLALRRPFYVLEAERIDGESDDGDDDESEWGDEEGDDSEGDDSEDDDSEEESEEEESLSTLAPDASYLGGSPGLPPQFDWPYAGDVPLVFVGQLNLADLPPLDGPDADLLPREGVLSLFLFDGSPVDSSLRGPGRLFYFADPTTLVTTHPAHESSGMELATYALSASVAPPTLPGWEQPFYALLLDTFANSERDPYGKAGHVMRDVQLGDGGLMWGQDEVKHQLLGYPYVLQSDALAAAAFDESEPSGRPHPAQDSRPHAERAAGWRLLWQVDSDEDFELGDSGTLYVLMREDDLRARRFDQARIVWQMH